MTETQLDFPRDPTSDAPTLHVTTPAAGWPTPLVQHRPPPPFVEPRSPKLQGRRRFFARDYATPAPTTSTSLPQPPLESALATIADQNNRYSSVQAQLLLMGAGAAAEAKARNRELVSRNEQLVAQQSKLESENMKIRELKNRAVVLSQENARLTSHANDAAQLRQRNSNLEAQLGELRGAAAAKAEAVSRADELASRCAALQEEVKKLREANAALHKTAASEGTRQVNGRDSKWRPLLLLPWRPLLLLAAVAACCCCCLLLLLLLPMLMGSGSN